MHYLLKIYRLLNLLSIDVALGAVCSALFFSKIFSVSILPFGLMALALSVWIIYTTDHLLDARKASHPAATERHQFHQRNFKVMTKLVVIAIMLNCVLIYFIRTPVLMGGMILIAGVGIYLIVQQYMKIFKEVLIALLYTMGVALPAVAVTDVSSENWPRILFLQFFLMAFANLLIFAWFDYTHDLRDKHESFVTITGEKWSEYFIWFTLVATILLTFISENKIASVFIVASDLVLLLIFIKKSFFVKNDRFRILGDAVFFIPLLYWLI